MLDAVASAAEVVAGVLGIAVTVVAIIVQLAAARYNHRITVMFVHEPRNVAVLGFFVLTTLVCLWVTALAERVTDSMALVTMILVTTSLLLLLPYFFYVFAFISPLSVIDRIRRRALDGVRDPRGKRVAVSGAIDELADATASAIDNGDRSIALTGIKAITDIVRDYGEIRDTLDETWFVVDKELRLDPDFVSLDPQTIDNLSLARLWLEEKAFRQLNSVFEKSIPKMGDLANAIGIETRELVLGAPYLERLGVRAFNSYLRASINADDMRTTYYLLNQYRLTAQSTTSTAMLEIARHIKYYGQLAHAKQQSFILEVAANDLEQLVEAAYEEHTDSIDTLIGYLLDLDEPAETQTQEVALIGVRRAQIHLATFLLGTDGHTARVQRVVADLRTESPERLRRLGEQMASETSEQYWELTPRDINFRYLPEQKRERLPELFELIRAQS